MITQYKVNNIPNMFIAKRLEVELYKIYSNGECEFNNITNTLKLDFNDEVYEENFNKVLEIINKISKDIKIEKKEKTKVIRKVLFLDGLDCANCAAKIERIAKRNLVNDLIVVDFATERFIIETEDQDLADNIIKRVKQITDLVDPRIIVRSKDEQTIKNQDSIRISKKEKNLFIAGLIFFALAVLTKGALTLWLDIMIPSYVSLICFAVAYGILGYDVVYGAIRNTISGRFFDEKFLMTLATVVALFIGYYEEAVSVMAFYKIGEICQQYAVNKSRRSIAALLDIKPSLANIIVNNDVISVNPLEVVVGDLIVVKPGERIPLDGVIVEGEALLDTSALTGETKYLEVGPKNEVLSGAINTNGFLKIKVEKIYEDSTVAKILNLVENASSLKSKSENFVSKFAKFYTPIICILAIFMAIMPIFNKDASWSDFQSSIYSAMIFLVVSCPCALVISIPLGFFGGLGGASGQGILVKGGNFLEALNKVGCIAFDKTGTLTKGKFTISSIVANDNIKVKEVLEVAAYCESTSNHPIAKAIVKSYGYDKILNERIEIHPKTSKFGPRIFLDGIDCSSGSYNYMEKIKIKVPVISEDKVVVYVVKDGKYIGYITVVDEIRPEAKQTIRELNELGITTAMLTGDKESVALNVANELGINKVYSGLLPVEKVKKLRQLKRSLPKNKHQVFVGDGINDAPVLSSADIGVAMGGLGSDAAISVADVVLMTDDLSKIVTATKIAKKTRRIVVQNIILAIGIKAIVLALAAFEKAYMWEAIFADVGVSLIAILNSLRAVGKKAYEKK